MHHIKIENPGDASVLKWVEAETPSPEGHEVLVKVHAAGVNRADLLQRAGRYPLPPGFPETLGLECAGEVVALGKKVARFKVGDRVFGLLKGGAYATHCLIHEGLCIEMPKSWSYEKAAAIPETFFTAHETLIELGQVEAEQTVLIHAGASGVGSTAIQMAKQRGATIITTAGSEEKCAAATQLGADLAIPYKETDFAEVIKAQYGGVDLILDFIGAAYLEAHINILKPKGRLICIGLLGGVEGQLHMAKVIAKRLQIMGSIMRILPIEEKFAIRDRFMKNWMPALEAGTIAPVIDRVFDIRDANGAHRHLQESKHIGKVLLKVI